jgi:hypothetical protein
MLFRRWHSVLVAGRTALAKPRGVAEMGRALVPFPCDLTVRRAVGVSHVLRPGCLSALSVCASGLQYLTPRRPGVCRRADVGLGDICLFGSGRRGHNPDALAAAPRFERGGCMNIATAVRQPCPAPSSVATADYLGADETGNQLSDCDRNLRGLLPGLAR